MRSEKKRFVLVDSNSIVHRAYHAYPSTLSTSQGLQTNAVYGFVSILFKVIETLEPDCLIGVFDTKKPTVRHDMYKQYKANRKPTDRELLNQIPMIKKVLEAFGIPILEFDGYEADDIIGTLENDESIRDFEKVIVSGDQDLFQLVDDDTKIFLSGRNIRDSKLFSVKEVEEKWGVKPEQVVDYKALCGDPSDNIPGVKGIGKKGAVKLLNKFGNLDNIYDNLDKISTRYKNCLEKGKEEAYLSRQLAEIIKDVKVSYKVDECKWGNVDLQKIKKLFKELEFRSLMKKVLDLFSDKSEVEIKEDVKIESFEEETIDENNMVNFLNQLNRQKKFVLFCDDIKESCMSGTLQKFGVAWNREKIYLVDFDHFCKHAKSKKILQNKSLLKASFGFKKLIHAFKNKNIDLKGIDADIELLSFLTEGGGVSLQDLAFKHLGLNLTGENDTQMKMVTDQKELLKEQTAAVVLLEDKFRQKLSEFKTDEKWNIYRIYEEIEKPLIHILVEMERNGILVDCDFLEKYEQKLDDQLEKIEKEIYSQVGHDFNINSPSQVGEVLFEELKLPGAKRTKTGKFSTSVDVLEGLCESHPIVKNIIKHRELAKLKSTYTSSLIQSVDEASGRIHTTFSQTGATTGRLVSSNPNVQNIPIATKLGRQIRKAFIAPQNSVLISFDYSQQELRILAHLSNDEKLKEAFEKNRDIHKVTASNLFEKDIEDITKKERIVGKTVNFAVMYGMSAHGLSTSLKVEYKQAEKFIEKYFVKYKGVKLFFEQYLKEAKEKGYAENMFGRRRDAIGLSASNFGYREATIREIKNFPIQSAAADIVKVGMINVANLINKKYKGKAGIVLQIHDEIVIEFSGRDTADFKNEVCKKLEKAVIISVPWKVSSNEGVDLEQIH